MLKIVNLLSWCKECVSLGRLYYSEIIFQTIDMILRLRGKIFADYIVYFSVCP